MARKGRAVRSCLAGGLVLAAAGPVGATDFAVQTGNFTDPPSWSGGMVPQASDDANINNGGTATIRPNDAISVNTLHVATDPNTTGTLVMTGGVVNVNPADNGADNAVAIGEFGVGTFNMSGGTLNLGSLTQSDFDFHVGKSSKGSTMTMTGGTINMGATFRVARGEDADATAVVSILGGVLNTGSGIVVARGDSGDVNTAEGTFIVGGTGKFIAGNSMGEGNAGGFTDEGFFSIGNRVMATGHVTVKDMGVIKALRLTARQGHGDLTVQDHGQFFVVNTLGATGAGALYNSYLGGGSSSNGDGSNGDTGAYTLTLKGSGLLDVDANAANRDATRPELQGFALARGNSTVTATIQDNASLVVRQRFIIGGLGAGAQLNGFDGGGDPGTDPGGTAVVNMTGGTISTDHLIVGGTGTGTLNVSGGTVKTQAYASTFDPDADMGNGSATTSVNSIRIGMLMGSTGVMNVSGTAVVSTGGDLGIGQYGTGTLRVTGGAASIAAKDVFVQKFKGSAGTLVAEITGPTQTAIRASGSVTINGGTFQVVPTAVPVGAHLYDILVADSNGGGTGTLTGTFTTVMLPPADATGRRWSALYEPKKFQVGLGLPGDANFDSSINFADLLILAQHYGQKNANWLAGDFNADASVGFDDLLVLAQNYGRNYGGGTAQPTSVPEPAIVALAAVGLLCARRRNARA